MEPGRVIQTLLVTASQVAQVAFSQNGRHIAVLSHDWRLGVWEAGNAKLLHVFDTPRGWYADNAGWAFDEDEKRLAFCTGRQAKLCSVECVRIKAKIEPKRATSSCKTDRAGKTSTDLDWRSCARRVRISRDYAPPRFIPDTGRIPGLVSRCRCSIGTGRTARRRCKDSLICPLKRMDVPAIQQDSTLPSALSSRPLSGTAARPSA